MDFIRNMYQKIIDNNEGQNKIPNGNSSAEDLKLCLDNLKTLIEK